ncbi:uncharacterized protein LOC113744745 [Scomber scombrus]|uniref:Uncharacterized protein LOC113744745 n=1 Tax=Scomber scombrus TaxID=13677 RepID=A0AAV1QAQ9_SCOSC
MKDFLTSCPSTYIYKSATVIIIFTYTILMDRDMPCTCKPQDDDCNFYMGVPFLIVFVLILRVDRNFQRVWRYTCTPSCTDGERSSCSTWCCNSFLWISLRQIIKTALVALLWVVSVLIDGDWWVCCRNDRSVQQAQLACKDIISTQEKAIISELKYESWRFGFLTLLGILCVCAIMSSFGWRKCCGYICSCCNRDVIYDELILEEEENIMPEILRKKAKRKLRERLFDNRGKIKLNECFNVGGQLIEERQQQRRQREGQHRPLGQQNEDVEKQETSAAEDEMKRDKDVGGCLVQIEECERRDDESKRLIPDDRNPNI